MRCQTALPARLVGGAELGEIVGSDALAGIGESTGAVGRGALGEQLTGKGPCVIQQAFAAIGQAVEQAEFEGAAGTDRLPRNHHVQRRLDADQARQALGAAGARQQAEVDLRQAETGVGFTDSVAAGQGQFQPAAEGEGADGRDQRLVQHGQAQQQVGQVRRGEGGVAAEFADVGTGAEQPVFAMEDDGLHLGVSGGAFAGVEDGSAQRLAEGVDRRAGQTDQGQAVFETVVDQVAHGSVLEAGEGGIRTRRSACRSTVGCRR
ncbi:hypothetical protein D3C84_528130 [compost metagenome]